MGQYEVEVRCDCGGCREVYVVEADSEEDAMAAWDEGHLRVSEVLHVEPVSARLENG